MLLLNLFVFGFVFGFSDLQAQTALQKAMDRINVKYKYAFLL